MQTLVKEATAVELRGARSPLRRPRGARGRRSGGRRGRDRRDRRAVRMREVDAAGAGRGPPGAGRGPGGRAGRVLHAAEGPAAAVARRPRQRRARARGGRAPGAPRPAAAPRRCSSASASAGFERTPPYELSGGMRQRVAFLRTLLPGRPLLLLDEPFASLDSLTRAEMQAWLAEALAAEPRTTLLVTHDVEEALYLADRVAVHVAAAGPRRRRDRGAAAAPAAAARDGHGPGVRRAQGAGAGGARMLRRVLPALGLLLLALARLVVGGELGLGGRPAARLALRDAGRRSATTATLLLDNAWVTLVEVLLGLAIAIAAGVRCSPSPCTSSGRCATPPTPCSSPRRRSRSSCSPRSSCSRSTTASARSSRSWR